MYLDLETYHRPETVAEALAQLAAPGTAAIAGGTSLNVAGHERLRVLVDLQRLPLRGVTQDGRVTRIGAMTTLAEVLRGDLPSRFAALVEAAAAEQNRAVRNRSTIGGRVSRGRANARIATALLALGAEVEVLSAGKYGVSRAQPALADHLAAVASASTLGLVAAVHVPSDVTWSRYVASSLTAVDAPTTDAALAASPGGVRIATGGHATAATGTVFLPETSARTALLAPGTPEAEWRSALRDVALAEIPAHTDALASGDYRRDLAATLVLRLVAAWLAAASHRGAA